MFGHALEEFGPEELESMMHNLLQLRQTGSVVEDIQQFKVYMYNLLALDATFNPRFFVTQFPLGLKDEMRAAMHIQAPTSITHAKVFAGIQEEELEHQHPRLRLAPAGRPHPLPYTSPTPGRPPTTTPAPTGCIHAARHRHAQTSTR